MRTRRTALSRIGIACALGTVTSVCVAAGGGVTVHRWVDESGVTHFSDLPPGDETRATVLDIDVGTDRGPDDPTEDYYSVANQWRRLAAERDAREARRLERRYVDNLARAAAPTPSREARHDGVAGPFAVPLGPSFGYPGLGPGIGPVPHDGDGRPRRRAPVVVDPPRSRFSVPGPGRDAQIAREIRQRRSSHQNRGHDSSHRTRGTESLGGGIAD